MGACEFYRGFLHRNLTTLKAINYYFSRTFVSFQAFLITDTSDLHLTKHFYALLCSLITTTLTNLLVFTIANFPVTLILKPLHTLDSDTFLEAELLNRRIYLLIRLLRQTCQIPIILFLRRLSIFSVISCLCALFITRNIGSIFFLRIYKSIFNRIKSSSKYITRGFPPSASTSSLTFPFCFAFVF